VGSTTSEVIASVSNDGVIKFWKKSFHGIEFVKSFKAHVGNITSISMTFNGHKVLTASSKDCTIKLYDSINYDIMTMKKITELKPHIAEFLNIESLDTIIAMSDNESNLIHIYNIEKSENVCPPLKIHNSPITAMKCNSAYNTMISTDKQGLIEYWDTTKYTMPSKIVKFSCKSETDLYYLAKVIYLYRMTFLH
jgi:peptidylprolyl isomerase domain and WD repeat-containing protein 1